MVSLYVYLVSLTNSLIRMKRSGTSLSGHPAQKQNGTPRQVYRSMYYGALGVQVLLFLTGSRSIHAFNDM